MAHPYRSRVRSERTDRNMPRLFAFLRAINAGPRRTVRMDVLRHAFESLGFSGVATFLGAGNIVFETGASDVELLRKKIERRLRQALGYPVPVFIRTPTEVKGIAALGTFEPPELRGADINIILLADNLDEDSRARLKG